MCSLAIECVLLLGARALCHMLCICMLYVYVAYLYAIGSCCSCMLNIHMLYGPEILLRHMPVRMMSVRLMSVCLVLECVLLL